MDRVRVAQLGTAGTEIFCCKSKTNLGYLKLFFSLTCLISLTIFTGNTLYLQDLTEKDC